jgi:hypothetical protein
MIDNMDAAITLLGGTCSSLHEEDVTEQVALRFHMASHSGSLKIESHTTSLVSRCSAQMSTGCYFSRLSGCRWIA